MRILLELIRIILIFGLLGGLAWMILGNIYTVNETAETYSWLGALAIFVVLFVLYRNKLQFSGWYKGKGRNKLPKNVSYSLMFVSMLLLLSPLIVGFLFG